MVVAIFFAHGKIVAHVTRESLGMGFQYQFCIGHPNSKTKGRKFAMKERAMDMGHKYLRRWLPVDGGKYSIVDMETMEKIEIRFKKQACEYFGNVYMN